MPARVESWPREREAGSPTSDPQPESHLRSPETNYASVTRPVLLRTRSKHRVQFEIREGGFALDAALTQAPGQGHPKARRAEAIVRLH